MFNDSLTATVDSVLSCPNDADLKRSVICRDDDILAAPGRLSPLAMGLSIQKEVLYERRYASKLISYVGKFWTP